MKKLLLALCLVLPLAAESQAPVPAPATPQPSSPRVGIAPGPGVGPVPGRRVLPGITPTRPGLPAGGATTPAPPSNLQVGANPAAQTNSEVFNSLVGNNEELQSLQTLLLNLQNNMEQAVPALYGAVHSARGATPALIGRTTGQGVAGGQVFVATVGTNSFEMNRETLQLLSTVVTDLQRTIPALRALNGTVSAGPGLAAVQGNASFANRFTPIHPGTQQQIPRGPQPNSTVQQQNANGQQQQNTQSPMLPTGR